MNVLVEFSSFVCVEVLVVEFSSFVALCNHSKPSASRACFTYVDDFITCHGSRAREDYYC